MHLRTLLPIVSSLFLTGGLAACSSSNTAVTSEDAGAGGDGSANANGNPTPDADASDANDSQASTHKRVFVTSGAFTGAIDPQSSSADGTPDGDAACNAAALKAGLRGTFKAWLSGYSTAGNVDAVSRLSDVGGWYLVGADVLVFANKAALTAPPAHAVDHDENGQEVAPAVLVWTATGSEGKLATTASGGFCNSWTSESAGNTGVIGKAASTTEWTSTASLTTEPCNAKHALYCFEQ
jgi:hypothetical protein